MKYKIELILVLLMSFVYIFAMDVNEGIILLLSKDYAQKIFFAQDDSEISKVFSCIAYGVRYMENLAWIDKDRFYDSLEELKREELPEEIIIGLDVLETAISTSTVGALALLEESAESSVAAAIALRLYKIDWTETRDPNSGKAMLRIAETLQKKYPEAYLPYEAIFLFHSSSVFGDKSEFLRYRDIVLGMIDESDEFSAILQALIKGEYYLGLYEELLEDYRKLTDPGDETKFYAAMAEFETGSQGTAEILLKDTNLSSLPSKMASKGFEVLGKIAENEGNTDSAIYYFKRAIKFNGKNRDALVHLGFLYMNSDLEEHDTLARYYFEMSGMEDYDPEVAEALNVLRKRLVLRIIFYQVLPLIAAVVLGLILVEYIYIKRRKKQEEEALRK